MNDKDNIYGDGNETADKVPHNLAELLKECVVIINRHLSLPPGADVAIALWIAFAHAIDAAEFSPRLAFVSPLPECGKTTTLELISLLTPKPMATSNITPAVIFRLIEAEHPTLIIDEADTFLDASSEISGILNSGHKRALAFVMRCVKDNSKDYVTRSFSTWTPIVIAKIGKLPAPLESRSIVIPMQRARADERLLKLGPADHSQIKLLGEEFAKLISRVLAEIRQATPAMPVGLSNRVADNWRTMFALADLAGGGWPERARDSAQQLAGRADPAEAVQLLNAMRRIFKKHGAHISSADFCGYLARTEDDEDRHEYTPRSLASMLKPFGIKPKTLRIGDKTPKGYELAQFEATFQRYVDNPADTKDA